MLRKIDIIEFKKLYRKHIINDFPRSERASLKKFKKRIQNQHEEAYIYEDNGEDKAYIIVANLKEYIFVTYLAVYKKYRGEGIGTKLLKEMQNHFKNLKAIFLEVEKPETVSQIKEKEKRNRRIKFYEKANYKILKNIKLNLYNENFYIMAVSPTNEEIKDEKIYQKVEEFYKKIFKSKYNNVIKLMIEKNK